jgi:hypothetical protein
LPEGIRGKEVLDRFHSLYQEPLAALVEEAVRVFAGIVSKLPRTSLKERTGIVEKHVQDSIIRPNTRKGPVERWLMQASGWTGSPDVLIGVYEEKFESSWVAPKWLTPPPPNKAEKHNRKWFLQIGRERVPVKKEFALRYNKKLDGVLERAATSQLILELNTTLEARILHVLDLNLKKLAATLLPDPGKPDLRNHDDSVNEKAEKAAETDNLDRLRYGKQCMQMVDEIKNVQRMYLDRGFTFEEIKMQNPDFLLWSLIFPRLSGDDRDTLVHPGTWARRGEGGVTGYARRVLGTAYNKSPATIQDWIKDYKLHRRKTTAAAITPKTP